MPLNRNHLQENRDCDCKSRKLNLGNILSMSWKRSSCRSSIPRLSRSCNSRLCAWALLRCNEFCMSLQRHNDLTGIPRQGCHRLHCIRWCSQCRAESLTEDAVMMRESIRLCSDCLELCRTCVALLTASSEFAQRVCDVCADLCEACAAECGKHKGETMRQCAEACRRCAATCRDVAQAEPLRRAASE